MLGIGLVFISALAGYILEVGLTALLSIGLALYGLRGNVLNSNIAEAVAYFLALTVAVVLGVMGFSDSYNVDNLPKTLKEKTSTSSKRVATTIKTPPNPKPKPRITTLKREQKVAEMPCFEESIIPFDHHNPSKVILRICPNTKPKLKLYINSPDINIKVKPSRAAKYFSADGSYSKGYLDVNINKSKLRATKSYPNLTLIINPKPATKKQARAQKLKSTSVRKEQTRPSQKTSTSKADRYLRFSKTERRRLDRMPCQKTSLFSISILKPHVQRQFFKFCPDTKVLILTDHKKRITSIGVTHNRELVHRDSYIKITESNSSSNSLEIRPVSAEIDKIEYGYVFVVVNLKSTPQRK